MLHSFLIIFLTFYGVHSMKDGRQAVAGEFPYVVSIQQFSVHLCSGTIIDENHIITAGHPITFTMPSELLVVAGMVVVRYPWFRGLKVKDIYLHPDLRPIFCAAAMNDLCWENDIAILRLTGSLIWGDTIAPVSLSDSELDSYGCFQCTIISWNYSQKNTRDVVTLMWDVVHILENDKCHELGTNVLPNQKCFVDLFETASISSEDLGSPIICGNSMFGLNVNEERKGVATSPSTLLSVMNYSQFITDIINDNQVNAAAGEFPYVVSIWYRGKYTCGGVIVDTYHVLTAGHCLQVDWTAYTLNSFKIAAGNAEVSRFDRSIRWFAVSKITFHPNYTDDNPSDSNTRYTEHDIGVLRLAEPMFWGPRISNLKLANSDDYSTEQWCQVLHWKREDKETNKELRRLKKSSAILVDEQVPNLHLGRSQFAATNPYSMHIADITDIGNPIVCGGQPLGILIRVGSTDAQVRAEPMIFLRIRPYYDLKFLELP